MEKTSPTDTETQTEGAVNNDEKATTDTPATTATPATTTTTTTTTTSKEDLLELVRAIKFAKPEASQKQVHKEITEELSTRHDNQFAFLKHVQLNDVKKVWKKALKQPSTTLSSSSGANANTTTTANTNTGENSGGGPQQPTNAAAVAAASPNADLLEKLQANNQASGNPKNTVQLFTVGDGSIKHLAHDYTAARLAQEAAKEQAAMEELAKNFVHVFLDVPMDKSGSRPHQALINFQQQQQPSKQAQKSKGSKGKSSSNKGASHKSSTSTTTTTTTSSNTNEEEKYAEEIVKIQMAAPLTDEDVVRHPMLVYNQSRTAKTFIHYDPEDEHKGYERIQEWIQQAGKSGALGMAGGTKAYFYSRMTSRKKGSNILSVRINELAPTQTW